MTYDNKSFYNTFNINNNIWSKLIITHNDFKKLLWWINITNNKNEQELTIIYNYIFY